MARPHRIIGLVGQVCAGKSSVAKAFQRRGAELYEADKLVHELYEREDVKKEVRTRFGEEVFDTSGAVDRSKLGKLVFGDSEKLRVLTEEIIFPRTGEILKGLVAPFRNPEALEKPCALVVDAPTLFEAGRDGACDAVVFVAAPQARRETWAREQRGWTPEELARREKNLMDEDVKRKRCDAVIENNGSLDDLDRQVGDLWKRWIVRGEH